MKLRGFILLALFLAGCSSKPTQEKLIQAPWPVQKTTRQAEQWMPFTEQAAKKYGISPRLITAIIAVESGGNPSLVSRSNAVGLMQIKASTAGREVYRHRGMSGQPSTSQLKDPQQNIDIGTAYLNILEHGPLRGIAQSETMQYALVVAYVNGAGALLRTFSSDRQTAIEKINALSPDAFYQYIMTHHPAAQAPRYLWKIQQAMAKS